MARIYHRNILGKAPQPVSDAKRFYVTIQGERFAFAVHHVGGRATPQVGHWASGNHIRDIPYTTWAAHRGDLVSAGKATIAALVAEKGEARVRSVLASAPKLEV